MAILLSLESSTSVCSAALHDNGELMASREVHNPHSAAAQLTVLVDELFSSTGISKKNIEAVAVSGGPGSYTGLRISVATAKGICYGLNRPLIVIDSLHVLASAVQGVAKDTLLCPMIDARRMEVYCCLLDMSLNVMMETQHKIIDESSFSDWLVKHKILFFGNGAEKCKAILGHHHAAFLESAYPRAAAMGSLAFQKLNSGEFADLRLFEPYYLKEFAVKTKKV